MHIDETNKATSICLSVIAEVLRIVELLPHRSAWPATNLIHMECHSVSSLKPQL